MKFPFYQGSGIRRSDTSPALLPQSKRATLLTPESYVADEGLKDACNVALLLNQPLLLTGEPGTGKTQFAFSVAWELGFPHPLKFETKSNSAARDLFYIYDALKRFQDIQSQAQLNPRQLYSGTHVSSSTEPLNYLKYQALGLAILQANHFEEVKHLLPHEFPAFERRRSVVLIDEIDKAPRDFPNDMLNELDQMYFRIPELGNVKVEAAPEMQPIVIITSNSEKDLPDAFLRRCIYYHIPFPSRERLSDIVTNRLGLHMGQSGEFLDTALTLFYQLRQSGLRKKPATAELLGWLTSIRAIAPDANNPLLDANLVYQTLSSLVKTAEDQHKARTVVSQCLSKQSSNP